MSAVPEAMAAQMAALRGAIALATGDDDVSVLKVRGPGAFALLDRVSTAPLFVREGEARQSLFLHETGALFADVLVARDEDGFFLLAEGPDEATLLAYLEAQRQGEAAEASIESLRASHAIFGLHGPYAWELVAALFGPAVLGMSFLSFMRVGEGEGDEVLCFRAGKTGEYGYDLLVPRERAPALREKLEALGAPLGLAAAGRATLDQAALENLQLNMRVLAAHPRFAALTPIELQLQWRVAYDRAFLGAEALRARRDGGAATRATSFIAPATVAVAEAVSLHARPVGEILAVGFSPTRAQHVGIALLERRYAHPGITAFRVGTPAGEVAITTAAPPLIENRSLHVDPHRHRSANRALDDFPPLVPP